jgi:hypothetical protein
MDMPIEIGSGITVGGGTDIGDVVVPPAQLVSVIITEFYQDLQTEDGLDLTTE